VDYAITYAPISPINKELLSPRQREIFDLIVVGQSNKEIARTLGLSEGTVKIHITKLFEKLGVRHRSGVAVAGARLGLSLVPLPGLVAQIALQGFRTRPSMKCGHQIDLAFSQSLNRGRSASRPKAPI
jgi:DNA-binding CsgD family transcriptional regulator